MRSQASEIWKKIGQSRGMVQGGRREEGSGWGTRVYLWQIHVDIWQNQYNIVKFKKKKTQGNALGSPVVRTQHFHCSGLGSIPAWGTKILQATQRGKNKKESQTRL